MIFIYKIPKLIKYLRQIYRFGGFSTYNISSINHGEILKGKNILITGGGTGIGLSIAKKCLKEGAVVVITGRNQEKLKFAIEEVNNESLKSMVWDVSEISCFEEKIIEVESLFKGEIDVLVNNAGVLSEGSFPNINEEDWDKVYATNSKGLFFLTQAITKRWINRNKYMSKKIINISSQGGFVGATYPYRMTKWDVAGFTQGLGIKLAPFGIIVNGIAPGIIATNMQPDYIYQKDNIYCSQNPIGRFALPEEIAELAIFLLSDSANFIVGQTILCDGGFSIK